MLELMSQGSSQIIYCFLKLCIQTTQKKKYLQFVIKKQNKNHSTDKIHNPEKKRRKKKKIFPNICRAGKMFLVPDFTNILDFSSF